jgi:hypothetical protein
MDETAALSETVSNCDRRQGDEDLPYPCMKLDTQPRQGKTASGAMSLGRPAPTAMGRPELFRHRVAQPCDAK